VGDPSARLRRLDGRLHPFLGEGSNCPEPAGPDFDFGQARALFTVRDGSRNRDVVGAGQKSGQYWALDPDTGAVRWVTQAGPGGTAGGLQWGSAVDGRRVYTANANSNAVPWTLPNSTSTTDGMWSGIDAVTGELLWQTEPTFGGSQFGGGSSGPVTTANGVVFGCALDPKGHMYALNGATGASCGRLKVVARACQGLPSPTAECSGGRATASSARRTTSSTPSVCPAETARPIRPAAPPGLSRPNGHRGREAGERGVPAALSSARKLSSTRARIRFSFAVVDGARDKR
jgi:PQQ-like domain